MTTVTACCFRESEFNAAGMLKFVEHRRRRILKCVVIEQDLTSEQLKDIGFDYGWWNIFPKILITTACPDGTRIVCFLSRS